jgi:hypothetical protein
MVPLELAQQEGSAWPGPAIDAVQESRRLTAEALIRPAGALDTTVTARSGSRTTPVRGLAALHPVPDHLLADESTGDDRDVLLVIEPEHGSGRRIRAW